MRYIINFSILPFLNIPNRYEDVSSNFALSTAYVYSQWFMYSLGFYYFRKAIQHEKDLRILQENQSAAEMSFLTSQINPHFLYNTLNFFYAEALPVLPNLSKGIMLLSDMMRYAINNEEGDGKAPLENEVKHIKNFIEINQLRYGNRLYVHFELIGNTEYRRIMPLILVTFVENAFKHGELLSEQTPLEISLKIEENHLLFQLKNAIRKGPKEESEGIGLVNTRRRLTVAYPERHQLNVVESEGFYEVLLKMDL
jgi:two-component system, LytTR family, sensor kinase